MSKREDHTISDLEGMKRLHDVGIRCMRPGNEVQRCLDETVDAAIFLTSAQMGHLQTLDANGLLTIAAHRGFDEPFLSFFRSVRSQTASARNAAMDKRERVIVEDVTDSPLFAGEASLTVLLEAGVRAVQSTPLISSTGAMVGMLSTHFTSPHRPAERDLRLMDLLARQAADYLERKGVEKTLHQQALILRESEHRLQLALDAGKTGLWEWDVQRDTVIWSKHCFTIHGLREEEFDGTAGGFDRLVHPDDRARVWATVQAAVDQATQYECAFRIVRPDGEVRWVSNLGRGVYDDDGRPLKMVGTITDITERKRAEADRQKFVSLADQSLEFIGMCDLDFKPFYVNEAGRKLVGLDSLEQACAVPVQDYFFPEDRAMIMGEFFPRVLREGQGEQLVRFRHFKTGAARWMIYNVFQIKDENGEVTSYATVSRDITEVKEAEQALRESEERLTLALAGGDLATWDWDIGSGHVSFNERWARLREYEPSEVVPHVTSWTDGIHPDDQCVVKETLDRCLTGQDPTYECEMRVRTKTGGWRWILDRGKISRRDAEGRPVRMSGTELDITERKQMEQALRDSEARFAGIVTMAQDAIMTVDDDYRIVLFNPAAERMFGCKAADVLGTTVDRFVPFPSRANHREHMDRFARSGETGRAMGRPRRVMGCRATGEQFSLEANISKLTIGDRTLFTAILRDMSDWVRVEEELRRWNDELERRVEERAQALVQHQEQLRVLATELHFAEHRERKRLAEQLHDYLQQLLVVGKMKVSQGKRTAAAMPGCVQAFQDIDQLLSDALTYTRTLVAELSPSVLRQGGLLAGLRWLAEYMKKHELAVTVRTEPDVEVRLPEDQMLLLFQSVRELLINASKYAGTGTATVTVEQRPGTLQIVVRDEGAGFDMTAAAEAPLEMHSALSSKFGLLSIRERMRALGGSFEIWSTPGQGTTATVRLPVH